MKRIAVVLTAGAGRKFWPYADVRNKCAFPIANEPIVSRLVTQLRELGFPQIVVVVGWEERSVRAALRPLGDEGLRFVRQPASEPPGTTTATLTALDALGGLENDTSLFVVYGDTVLSTSDLRAAADLARDSDLAALALISPLNGDRPQDWMAAEPGEARAKGGTRVKSIEGHGRDGSHRLTGVYAFRPAALPYLRSQPGHMTHVPVGGMPPAEADLADALATMSDEGLDVALLETVNPSVDMDKPWHIFSANALALKEAASTLTESRIDASASISDEADISGPIVVEAGATIGKRVVLQGPAWIGANARVLNGAIVGSNVMIGAGSRVSDYCLVGDRSVVGRECVVGHGGEFDGVMLDRSYIYHYSEIFGVLGLAVDIGAATVCGTLRFDDAETIHKIKGRRELPGVGSNATYFGDYSRTGVNVITQPGSKIGAYSCVGPGIVLYNDVPSRKLILLKQETIERDWGPERYGW